MLCQKHPSFASQGPIRDHLTPAVGVGNRHRPVKTKLQFRRRRLRPVTLEERTSPMPGLLGPHSDAVHNALANGNAVALALVCLLQYVYSLLRISRVRSLASRYQEQVDTLSLEMLQLDRERMVHRLENQILRDVLTQSDCRKAIAILLKRFVPNSDDGFAAFVMSDIGTDPSVYARGLTTESVDALVLPDEIRDQLRIDGTIIWETPTPLAFDGLDEP
jgi:hypothetical protein